MSRVRVSAGGISIGSGTWFCGGNAGITLEVKGVLVVVVTSGVAASTSVGGLLELEINDFKEFTNPPEWFVTKSLVSGATLNRVDKFFYLLQTCQIPIKRAVRRVIPITICTIRIALGGMDNG